MALSATFYKFSKKKNSTARPSGGTLYSVELKANTEVLNPTILLESATYPDYNYAYILEFDRYYFVRAISWDMGLWSINLEVDALASWKSTIGAQSLYVTRSASEYNGDIMDNVYPTKTEIYEDGDSPSGGSPWSLDDVEDGTFVVGIIGTDVTYYAFSYVQYGAFLINLFSDAYLDGIVSNIVSDYERIKFEVNPLQFITSVMWFPFTFHSPTIQSIPVGYGSITASVEKLEATQVYEVTRTFTAPTHPQAATRGTFLNSRPYAEYNVYLPPFGKVGLNPELIAVDTLVVADITVDLRTGDATMEIRGGYLSTNVLAWNHSKVGIPFQISQVLNRGMDYGKLVQAGAGVAIGAIAGGPVGAVSGVIAGGVSAIGDYISGQIPSASTIGSAGGLNSLQGEPRLHAEFRELVDEDLTNRGRPLCELKTINTLTGFIIAEPSNVSIPAQASELDTIKQYMEGGFYYE